jgi:hypothetical protein
MRWIAIAAVLAVGCDDDGPPSCKQMAREMSRHGVIGDSHEAIDEVAAECKREGWPGQFRACIARAGSDDEADACEDRVRIGKKKDASRAPRRAEAEIQLERIEKAAYQHFVINTRFPEGRAGPTPSMPCCDSARSDRRCAPDPSAWTDPVWRELEFAVEEPHFFQYTYEGTGETFTAKAIGDLDCDGVPVEYVLEAFLDQGVPEFALTKPARAD